MNDTDIDSDYFRALLLQRKRELLDVQSTGADASRTVELDQTRVGRLSRMDALQAQAMSQETSHRRQLEIRNIDAALERIDSGDYGYCLECGEMIARQRLQSNPSTRLCIDCANASEQSG